MLESWQVYNLRHAKVKARARCRHYSLYRCRLLVWGFWPAARERHILPVDPSEMTLPTPSSFVPVMSVRRREFEPCLSAATFLCFWPAPQFSLRALYAARRAFQSLPRPTADLSQPSGGGGAAAVHSGSASTSLPVAIAPTATAESALRTGRMLRSSPPPAIPESRRLTLEYPSKIRTGDSDVIRLTLEVDTLGNITPTAEIQGNLVAGQTVQIPNLYDTHNVIAEARLDLAGRRRPASEAISEPLLPGQSVTFYWSVHPASCWDLSRYRVALPALCRQGQRGGKSKGRLGSDRAD